MSSTNNNEILYTPSGNPIIKTYEKITENGETHLIETGTTNIYDKIQESKDECDIKQIISRMTQGDASAIEQLDPSKAKYGDCTMMNKSLNEAHMIIKNANNSLNNLSEEEFVKVKELLGIKTETNTEEKIEENTEENTEEKKGVDLNE